MKRFIFSILLMLGCSRPIPEQASVRASTATAVGPVIPTSWTVPQWYVDVQNVSTCASDNNNGTSSTCGAPGVGPFLTFSQIYSRWGTYSPRLRQVTNITFLSSHNNNSDPVYLRPYLENGAYLVVQGTAPAVVSSGVILSGTIPKSRAAGSNSLLITTLGASGSVGLMVQNTTHPSRALVYKSLGANSFSMTQPMALQTIPTGLPPTYPVEVNSWADGDSVNLLRPISVNIVDLDCVGADIASANVSIYIYQLTGFAPDGIGGDIAYMHKHVQIVESLLQRIMMYTGETSITGRAVLNSFLQGGFDVSGTGENSNTNSGEPSIIGGATGGNVQWEGGSIAALDGDVILGAPGGALLGHGGNFGFVYLDGNVTVQSGTFLIESLGYGGATLYGAAGKNITMIGSSHLGQTAGTFVNTFTAPALISPGIVLNNASSACSHSAASTDVISCGITTTPTHLDAAQGAAGCGGNCFVLGGASVSNFN